MAYDLASITSDRIFRPPRIILLGSEKIGKSTFASSAQQPILIPIKGEEGIDDLQVSKFPVCNTLPDVGECLRSLRSEDHTFKTVVIDSASTLEALVQAHACSTLPDKHGNYHNNIIKAGGGWGVGYREANNLWRGLTEHLDILRADRNMTSIMIGHVKVRRFDDPEGESYDQYQWDIHEQAASLLYRWADVILFANTKVVVKKEDLGFNKDKKRGVEITPGARYLFTQKRPAHPGGGRGVFGRLPYELPLSWAAFIEAVNAAASQ